MSLPEPRDPAGPYRISMVCLGNICRSPTAETVFREHVKRAGLERRIRVESAGIGDWHVGQLPDDRAIAHGRRRGSDLEALRARQVGSEDFARFDLLVAMDRANRDDLLHMAPGDEARAKVKLLRELGEGVAQDVPDPYYGGEDGFADVVEIVERNCRALLTALRDGG